MSRGNRGQCLDWGESVYHAWCAYWQRGYHRSQQRGNPRCASLRCGRRGAGKNRKTTIIPINITNVFGNIIWCTLFCSPLPF